MKIIIKKSTYDSTGALLPEGVEYDVPDQISHADAKILIKANKAKEVKPAKKK